MQFEFHISYKARQKYQFDEGLFALDGNVIFADFSAARRFADLMTAARRMSDAKAQPVPASDINAMGLIDEILHVLVHQYETQNPGIMRKLQEWLDQNLGPRLDSLLLKFSEEFPPLAVYRGEMTPGDYLASSTGGVSHRLTTLEELFLLEISNSNPALQPYLELFDNSVLKKTSAYEDTIRLLRDYFIHQPASGSGGESLFELLLMPSKVSPQSLTGQLEFLLIKWGALLGEKFIQRILLGMDFIKEEIIRHTGPGEPGKISIPTFAGMEYMPERFSQDKDWMPRLLLIAKNSYVWLDQLSKKYQRSISRLDQIPDEELVALADRGITGLWLIGLWERSIASRRIKQMMGNPEAVSSAYSLMDYQIAADLGGQGALENLRTRAWQHRIRLSADMVPNHMAIDSKWVIEHPDWFLSIPYPPFPSYTFNGADLSNDPRVGIYIEDHYYDKTDAAVVFKRLDRWTGEVRYIYHGNDGTAMPWNDTAQLDFSKAEVREAVIQTILHVARNFPIIRFDAAMTLASQHIQRLWFPEPGMGGTIPSRSEHSLTRIQFAEAVPNEFWRSVVDRVAAEVSDTLLLAEAFWLMEGYFVRALGMHRVYNSAFMHMLRDEDNAKYRQVMKNVLEFDPQVLKRFVNFMTNPDEKSAAEQFGTTDKYFGVCTLMITLPGLPMFGHGQIEGFREKYGMEYFRPLWDESVDEGLVRGHEWRIFPLAHRRHIFADVEYFLLYDFYTPDGYINEDVFAFSNRYGEERGLVIFHNKYAETQGWVKKSTAFRDKAAGKLIQKKLGEGLDLPAGKSDYVIFRGFGTNLEYIRLCRELIEKGLYVKLNGYQCNVFLDFRLVSGDQWKAVCETLNGAGVPSIEGQLNLMITSEVKGSKTKAVNPKKTAIRKPKSRAAKKKAPRLKKEVNQTKKKN